MDKQIYFVAGVHGVGKTTYCKTLSKTFKVPHYSASELIKRWSCKAHNLDKKVSDIDGNQSSLLAAITEFVPENRFLLDGHFCLLDANHDIRKVPERIFSELAPKAVLVMHDDVTNIVSRIKGRDNVLQNESVLIKLQKCEIDYAKILSERLPFSLDFCKTKYRSRSFEELL